MVLFNQESFHGNQQNLTKASFLNKEKIYFDTSVPSAYYDGRTKERMEFTKEFWQHKIGAYELFVSTLVIDELSQTTPADLRRNLLKLVDKCTVLQLDAEVEVLAGLI